MTNVTQLNQTEVFRKRKSVALSKDDWNKLKRYRKGFNTEIECALTIGVDRNVLNSVLLKGTGSPDTISKIQQTLAQN